jgi:hypothetical protein
VNVVKRQHVRYIWRYDHSHMFIHTRTSMPSCRRAYVKVDSFVIDLKELTVLLMFSTHSRVYNYVISILRAEPASVGAVYATV